MPGQPLASKEASLFRQVLKHYEAKQYKKGLKAAEQILRKNPKHGETLAMKGLIINCLGRTDEGFAIAKEALKQDMKSHVCWHVYGLLWRSVKNFDEAIKAYKFALRYEPDSWNILRDLALLQIQMRDYLGYIESRRHMLTLRPHMRQSWTGLAIAYHLSGNYEEAEKVLDKYEATLKTTPPKTDMEHAEANLYKNTIIAESGDIERALTHLDSVSKNALDKLAVLEMRASYLLKLGRAEEAERAYRVLLDRNADRRDYYKGLEESKGLKADDIAARKALYEEYAKLKPLADAPKRIPLEFLQGEEFRTAADTYIRSMLHKGVPSIFANIKGLYSDESKRGIVLEIVEAFLKEQETSTRSYENDREAERAGETLVWTIYFIAQHHDHWRTRNTEKSLEYIAKAIDLSPDTLELHMTQARIYKHAGDISKAQAVMDHARQLDKSDRYINTKCAKYTLRANKNEEALKLMSLFTRNNAVGGPLGDLLEMQCLWYITEDGEGYLRQNQLGLALKRFHAALKIFEDWTEDQFDFHTFSLRKGQIRAYINMVRWEDTLYSHPFFTRAALSAVRAYILLSDKPHLAHGKLANGTGPDDFANMTTAERKKALKRAKREAQKESEKRAAEAAVRKDERKEEKKEDPDPVGEQLVQTKEPLTDALKFLRPLLEFGKDNLEVQILAFEVFVRMEKYLLAVRSLKRAVEINKEDPRVHEQLVRFRKIVSALPSPTTPAQTILHSTTDALLAPTTDIAAYNSTFASTHSSSPTAVFSAAQVSINLATPETLAAVKEDAKKKLFETVGLDGFTLEDARKGKEYLAKWGEGAEWDNWREKVRGKFSMWDGN